MVPKNHIDSRAIIRRTEFLGQTVLGIESKEEMEEILNNGKKKIILRYLLNPFSATYESDTLKSLKFYR